MKVSVIDEGTILFPSVKICKKYTYDQLPGVLGDLKSGKASVKEAREWFINHTWRRPRLVNFFSHSTVDTSLQHPCNTIAGPEAGAPCIFPFLFPDCTLARKSIHCKDNDTVQPKLHHNCIPTESDTYWCSTRTYQNKSHSLGHFGTCSPRCQAEASDIVDKKYNLASKEHDHLWDEEIFSLATWDHGHCYTYNPPSKSYSGFSGELYAFLAQTEDTYETSLLKGYMVYIHEKGQFWPGLQMERLGQTKPIFLEPGMELKGSFIVNVKMHMSKDTMQCTSAPNYSYTSCIVSYIARSVGCHLDWVGSLTVNMPRCTTVHQILAYQDKLVSVNNMQWHNISRESGCLSKCKAREFLFVEESREVATWSHNWSSSFFLTADRTNIFQEEEFLVFDKEDLFNGIGGALGLYLGWSLLHLVNVLCDTLATMVGRAREGETLLWQI